MALLLLWFVLLFPLFAVRRGWTQSDFQIALKVSYHCSDFFSCRILELFHLFENEIVRKVVNVGL